VKSGVRFFGYTKETCEAELGTFNADEGACYHDAENTVLITKNVDGQIVVGVNVIWGPANERSFEGVATMISVNNLLVREAEINDNGSVAKTVKGGCVMNVSVKGNTVYLKIDEEKCDANLMRADGAVKK
jgi:hypothetical protein